jgi:hypothetical protein
MLFHSPFTFGWQEFSCASALLVYNLIFCHNPGRGKKCTANWWCYIKQPSIHNFAEDWGKPRDCEHHINLSKPCIPECWFFTSQSARFGCWGYWSQWGDEKQKLSKGLHSASECIFLLGVDLYLFFSFPKKEDAESTMPVGWEVPARDWGA